MWIIWARKTAKWPSLAESRALRLAEDRGDAPQPVGDPVPTGENLVHHSFISGRNRPQVAERRCGYGGSNKAVFRRTKFPPERTAVGTAGAARATPARTGRRRAANAFCERQDALERYQGGVDRDPCSTATAQQECLLSLKAERRIGNNVLQTVAPERATRRGTSHPGAQSQAVVDREKLGDRHVSPSLVSTLTRAGNGLS